MKKKLLVVLFVLVTVITSGILVNIRPTRSPYPPPPGGGGSGGSAITVEFTL